jgi:hypothetical protein
MSTIVEPTKVQEISEPNEQAWEYVINLAAAGLSEIVMVPIGVELVDVSWLCTGAATCQLWHSDDKRDTVVNGSPLKFARPGGAVASGADTKAPCTAIQAQQVGTGTTKVCLQFR